MVSSYALRTDNTTTRTSLPAWAQTYQNLTTLTSSQYGPGVSSTYPLGRYIEDYNYTAGSGDLDQYNGRFCVTPDFPAGTYAYFVTIDAYGAPAFPYYLGPQYYGTVSGGNVTSIAETTSTYYTNHAYTSSTSTVPAAIINWLLKNTSQFATIFYDNASNLVTGPSTTWTGNTSHPRTPTCKPSSTPPTTSMSPPPVSPATSLALGTYNAAHRPRPFPNLPTNQNIISRIPLTPARCDDQVRNTRRRRARPLGQRCRHVQHARLRQLVQHRAGRRDARWLGRCA